MARGAAGSGTESSAPLVGVAARQGRLDRQLSAEAAGLAADRAGPAAGLAGPAADLAGPAVDDAGPAADPPPAADHAGPTADHAGPAADDGPAANDLGPAADDARPASAVARTRDGQTRLTDRYRLEERLSDEGGSSLWKATDKALARAVTVRTFVPGFSRLGPVVAAARAASQLNDRRLVQIFDADDSPEHRYIVSEWPTGERLDEVLAAGPSTPNVRLRLLPMPLAP